MSKGEAELKLNAAIERDAILECEQEELLSLVQRLRDEKRGIMLCVVCYIFFGTYFWSFLYLINNMIYIYMYKINY